MDGDHIGDPNTPMRWGPNTSLYMITQICIATLTTYIHNISGIIIRNPTYTSKFNNVTSMYLYKFFKNTKLIN